MKQTSVKITYYLEVISSWCFWVEPTWAKLKEEYADRVTFDWKISLMDESGLPTSRAQCEWFYRRSGVITRSPFMLNSGWFDPELKEYLAPNLVSEAAKDFGVTDDRVRLAISRAALLDGKKVGRWEESAAIGAEAINVKSDELHARAQSDAVLKRAQESTADFYSFRVNQRPAFLLENAIGDRAVLSGLVSHKAIAGVLDSMLDDASAYASYATHHGAPPKV
jgi:predicted DsbA family dithiol-disulfide isomerase